MKFVVAVTAVLTMGLGLAVVATAQTDRETMGAVYEASAAIETNIAGVHTFPAPPTGFNPLNATDTELASYGFPPRPSKVEDPLNYSQWVRAMGAAKVRWNGKLRDMGA
jgi:hypothetical protein